MHLQSPQCCVLEVTGGHVGYEDNEWCVSEIIKILILSSRLCTLLPPSIILTMILQSIRLKEYDWLKVTQWRLVPLLYSDHDSALDQSTRTGARYQDS